MTTQQRKLERLASAILGEGPRTDFAKPRSIETVSPVRNAANLAVKKRSLSNLLQTYRDLPKDVRRLLTAQFKTDRQANSTINWNDWLLSKAEIVNASQASGSPDHP